MKLKAMCILMSACLMLTACKKGERSLAHVEPVQTSPLFAEISGFRGDLPELYNRELHFELKGYASLALAGQPICKNEVTFFPTRDVYDFRDFLENANAAGYSYAVIQNRESGKTNTVFSLGRGSDELLGVWQKLNGRGDVMICVP